jgi:hypothetical protein
MARKKRVDANQAEIVKKLREKGLTVLHLHTVGDGAPDICVGCFGLNFLFEIKDPEKFPSQRKLTDDEKKFFDSWMGQVNKVETVEEIIEVINKTSNSFNWELQ